jgi:hypothetical protein
MTREELKSKDGVSVLLNFNGRKADSILCSCDPNNVTIHTIIPILIEEDAHGTRIYRLSDKDIENLHPTTDAKLFSRMDLKSEDLL